MGMLDNPGRSLRRMERQLRQEAPRQPVDLSPQEEEPDSINYAEEFPRAYYDDESTSDEDVYYEEDYRAEKRAKRRRKRGCSWGLVLFWELVGIACLIGWWIKWLG